MNEYHSFNVKLAKLVGIEKALILGRIHLFVDHNKKTNKNFFDGEFWMYDTGKALEQVYPYMTEPSIRRWMIDLEKNGWIKSSNYNTRRYDHTKWYALGPKFMEFLEIENSESAVQNERRSDESAQNDTGKEKCAVQNERSIVQNERTIVQNERPIPDIDHYRPDIKNIPHGDFSFEEFWELYDKKVGRPNAEKQFSKLSAADKEKIRVHLPRYVLAKPDKTFRKDPERYLKHKTFNDEIVEESEPGKGVEILTHSEMLERHSKGNRDIFKKYTAVDINGLRYVPNEHAEKYKPCAIPKQIIEINPQQKTERNSVIAEIIRNIDLGKRQNAKQNVLS
jgi:DNA-binding PadR family transcriptional regulator